MGSSLELKVPNYNSYNNWYGDILLKGFCWDQVIHLHNPKWDMRMSGSSVRIKAGK